MRALGRGRPATEWLLVAGVAILGLFLRSHDLTRAPLLTDNGDELQFTWAGLNMIQTGDAYTWSYYPAYPGVTPFTAFGVTYPMVHHWLDHPPLFSLVMGGWVWLLGDRGMLDVTADQVRVLPVLFGTATIVLIYCLGRETLGRLPAIAGATLLATAPGAVLLSRQAEPESLQAVLLLGSLLATLRLVRGTGGRGAVATILACSLTAPLLKVSGIAIGVICAVVLLVSGHWRAGALALAAAAVGVLIFIAYGWVVDWTIFVNAWKVQTGNRISVMSAYDFITWSSGVNRRLEDPWWILGWIGLGAWMATRRGDRELFLAWPVAAYAAAMLVMAGELQTQQYGWYKLIVYPEVYLAAGYLIWSALAAPTLSRLTVLLVLGGAAATNWWLGAGGRAWAPNPVLLAGLLGLVVVPAGVAAWRARDQHLQAAARWVATAAFLLLLAGNIAESMRLDELLFKL